MCTFVHSYLVFVSTDKDNKKGWIPSEEFSLIYFCIAAEKQKVLADTNSYKFEITAYTNNSMKLKLVESDFRFADHEKKYPLRTSVGTELTLERSIRA